MTDQEYMALIELYGEPQADESIEAWQNPEAYGTPGYDGNERFMFR